MKTVIKRERIEKKINQLYNELKTLQENCKHPNLEEIHGKSTGNYDTYSDHYWTDYRCPDCNKKWRVEIE